MVTEADIIAATHIRLPTKFAYQNRDNAINASCIARRSELIAATIAAYNRGTAAARAACLTLALPAASEEQWQVHDLRLICHDLIIRIRTAENRHGLHRHL